MGTRINSIDPEQMSPDKSVSAMFATHPAIIRQIFRK